MAGKGKEIHFEDGPSSQRPPTRHADFDSFFSPRGNEQQAGVGSSSIRRPGAVRDFPPFCGPQGQNPRVETHYEADPSM